MNRSWNEKTGEIIKFAEKNDNVISHNTVIDILKDQNKYITEDQILKVEETLNEKGIIIVEERDEGYPADEIDPYTFIASDINIGQKPITIYSLMERLDYGEIELEPGFQRHGNLWSLTQQSRLIESLMLKIPLPAFYFNAVDEKNWVVIDGLQRLTAFRSFLIGNENKDGHKTKEKFVGLQYLRDFEGFTFDDLPRQYIRRIKETSVIAYTVERGTPDAVVFNIFQRINTGGMVLNAQEIRQALYQGKATELIQRLAESEEFLRATQYSISKERMIDREYVTRYLAFTVNDYKNEYKGNIDKFLIKAMKRVNTCDDKTIGRIEYKFRHIMDSCAKIFGRLAFRKYNDNNRRGPINKALFEIWVVCFSELASGQLEQVIDKKDYFIDKFGILLKNNEFITALKAGDQYSMVRRIEMARSLVKEFL